MVHVTSTATMLLLYIISAGATSLGGRKSKHFIRQGGENRAKMLNTLGVLNTAKENDPKKMDITFRDGLGENLPYPGIGYLGTGYDITKGNPNGDTNSLLDPGYRAPIIKLDWSQDSRYSTRDMQMLIPTQAYGFPKVACQHATTATRQTQLDDYIDDLETDVTVKNFESLSFGVGSWSSKFANSDGVQTFRRNVEEKKLERFEMKSYCVQYQQTLQSPANELETLPYFNRRVGILPTWPVVTLNACRKNFCSNLFFPKLEKFLTVNANNELVLQTTAPKEGRWLFAGMWKHVKWVTKANNWKIVDSTLLLTRGKDDSLSMKAASSFANNHAEFKNQQWTYDPPSELLYTVAYTKRLYIGLDNSKNTAVLKVSKDKPFGQSIRRNHFDQKLEGPWLEFFQEFGTHFVNSVVLGGRMVTTVTLTHSDVKNVEKDGVSATTAVAQSFGIDGSMLAKESPFSAMKSLKGGIKDKDSTSRDQQKEAVNAVFNSKTDAKTFVLGGDPPENIDEEAQHGFGEWAKTVPKKPMPVKIQLKAIIETAPFQCHLFAAQRKELPKGIYKGKQETETADVEKYPTFTVEQTKRCHDMQATLAHAYVKYQSDALQAATAYQLSYTTGETAHLEKGDFTNFFKPVFTYICGSKIRSSNGKYTAKLNCDGNLVIINRNGVRVWETDSAAECSAAGGEDAGLFLNFGFGSKTSFSKSFRISCGGKIVWNAYSVPSKKLYSRQYYCNTKKLDVNFTGDMSNGAVYLLNNGNLVVKYKRKDEVNPLPQGGFTIWQSGSGRDMDIPAPYDSHQEKYGYQMCSENQKELEEQLAKNS